MTKRFFIVNVEHPRSRCSWEEFYAVVAESEKEACEMVHKGEEELVEVKRPYIKLCFAPKNQVAGERVFYEAFDVEEEGEPYYLYDTT